MRRNVNFTPIVCGMKLRIRALSNLSKHAFKREIVKLIVSTWNHFYFINVFGGDL